MAEATPATLRALQIGMTASHERAGGLDRYYFSLVRALAGAGVASSGFVTGEPGDAGAHADVRLFARESERLAQKCWNLRATASPAIASSDLVVSHFAPYAFALLDRLRAKPFVVHFHGPWALEGRAEGAGAIATEIKRRVERAVYGRAARVVVLSSAFGDIVTSEYGVAAERVRVIPGGVDLERFNPVMSRAHARERLGWPRDRPTVVTVRRLVRAKGVDRLIAAAELARERVPGLVVVVAGTGPLAQTLHETIVRRGLEDTVRMAGRVAEDDLPLVYRAADLFVVPTIVLEGFGLVVLESLASGTPALVTPVGGLGDLVRPLEPSLVLEGSAPELIAQGMTAALLGTSRVPDEAECIAYARGFAWSDVARSVAGVYREAISANSRSSLRAFASAS